MGPPNEVARPSEGTGQVAAGGPGDATKTTATTLVADVFRAAAGAAGLDLVALGVRDDGPLDWTPDDPPPTEPPVAIVRRRILARRRVDAIEHRRRRDRMYAEWFAREAS